MSEPLPVSSHPGPNAKPWVVEFERHMENVLGLALGTRVNYVRLARA